MFSNHQHTSFGQNWNGRLFADVFSDARDYNPEKYAVGSLHDIYFKSRKIGVAEVVASRKFRFCEIRDAFSYLICGQPAYYLAAMLTKFYAPKDSKIHPDKEFIHVIWKWKARDIEAQNFLITEWWKEATT